MPHAIAVPQPPQPQGGLAAAASSSLWGWSQMVHQALLRLGLPTVLISEPYTSSLVESLTNEARFWTRTNTEKHG
jgi:hypothetical protein